MENCTVTRLNHVDAIQLLALEQLEEVNMGAAAVDRYTLRLAADAGAIWVLEHDGQMAGACVALGNLGRGDVVELFSFHLSGKLRGQGVGEWFWGRVMAAIDADGFTLSRLSVKPDNQRAISVYRKHGFQTVKEAVDYYGPGEDRLIMERRIR